MQKLLLHLLRAKKKGQIEFELDSQQVKYLAVDSLPHQNGCPKLLVC